MRCILAWCLTVSIINVYKLSQLQTFSMCLFATPAITAAWVSSAMLQVDWHKHQRDRTSTTHAYTLYYLTLTTCFLFPTKNHRANPKGKEGCGIVCCLCSRNAYGHLELYYLFVLDCYAWYIYGTMDGRRAETGATLSANHVYPVGGVAHEARRWHSYALSQSGTDKRPCTQEVDIMKVDVEVVESLVNPPWFDCLCIK